MPKPVYTASDIKTLAQRGVRSLEVTQNAIITDLAREIARELGVSLIRGTGATPQSPPASTPTPASDELAQRIQRAVTERLGDQIEADLLEAIIRRVRRAIGV